MPVKKKPAFSFGIKYKIVSKSINVIEDYRYLEHTDGHNKYYRIQIFPPFTHYPGEGRYTVLINYGKIQSTRSTIAEYFISRGEAEIFLGKKVKEKLAKGYRLAREPKWDY